MNRRALVADGAGSLTLEDRPWLEPRPGEVWVGGYGGHGLAQAFRMGRLAVSTSQAAVRPD